MPTDTELPEAETEGGGVFVEEAGELDLQFFDVGLGRQASATSLTHV